MSTIQLDWESPDEATWQQNLSACGRSTAFQSWSWGAASEAFGEATIRRAYILKNGRPVGQMQLFEERRLGLFTLGKLIRGPLFFHPVMPEDRISAIQEAMKSYPMSRLKRMSLLPEISDGPAVQAMMSTAGFHSVLGGYDTIWLDLRQPLDVLRTQFRQNFRNQLRRAEEQVADVRQTDDPRILLEHYDAHRRARHYSGPSGAMLAALPDADLLCLQAFGDDGGAMIAGVLFVLHGRAATYQVGWTSSEGRQVHAHNLLLWRALPDLIGRGIQHLDLGGLDWEKAPGVAHFKTGLGGETFSLPGTFV